MLEIDSLLIVLGGTKIEIPHLDVEDGDYLAIMGTTGAGKTVFLETIAGFHTPVRGEIKINGKNIVAMAPHRRGMAIVYQDYMLFPHMSARENIEYPLRMRKLRGGDSVRRMAELLEIEHLLDRYPGTLSGGEQQRVAIARALITNPRILLMDEPFSSLDRKTRERVRKTVKNAICETGATVIHITHDLETARIMANKIAIMHDGKLVQSGDINDILSRPGSRFVAEFVDANILRGRAKKDGAITVVEIGENKIYVSEEAQGDVYLSIRPEDIIVSKEKIKSSMRNSLYGRIKEMRNEGRVVRLTLDFDDFVLYCILTPNAVEALSLREGDDIFAYFKASSVRVL
jgi:molybdate transport system ATP-binding protein